MTSETRGVGKGPDKCVCPVCGHEEEHEKGKRCMEKKCPKCDSEMTGKWEEK